MCDLPCSYYFESEPAFGNYLGQNKNAALQYFHGFYAYEFLEVKRMLNKLGTQYV